MAGNKDNKDIRLIKLNFYEIKGVALMMIGQLKNKLKGVKNSGKDHIFGLGNEYLTKDGETIAVGFTSCSAYVIDVKDMDGVDSETGYADFSLWETAIDLWVKSEKQYLDYIDEYEEVKTIAHINETGEFEATKLGKELFAEQDIKAILKKLEDVFNLVSGEIEVDPSKLRG